MTSGRLFLIFFYLWNIQIPQSSGQNGRINLVTCDLDPDIPLEAHKYLPTECAKLTDHEKMLAVQESKAFAKWQKKLIDYEKSKDPNFYNNTYGIPKEQWELRADIANATKLWECYSRTAMDSYYECMEEKRNQMIELLDKKVEGENAIRT